MAQLLRGQKDECEQAKRLQSATQNRPQEASKLSQHINHDKLCDSIHEKVINSELSIRNNISSLTLKDGRRCLSMQERSSKAHNLSDSKRD